MHTGTPKSNLSYAIWNFLDNVPKTISVRIKFVQIVSIAQNL